MATRTRVTNPICYVPPNCPKAVRKYLAMIMKDPESGGRDNSFESTFMKNASDAFPWEVHGEQKPELRAFCRWGFSACKRGLGLGGTRKTITIPSVSQEIKDKVVEAAISVAGIVQDSFIGSDWFYRISAKYGIDTTTLASVLISHRKKTPSGAETKIYIYRPEPESKPDFYKIGHSEYPVKRMEEACKNTGSERPQMIAWFYGKVSEEADTKRHFASYNIKGLGGKELFRFPDADVPLVYFQEKIREQKGKICVGAICYPS